MPGGVTLLTHPLVRRKFASPVPPGSGWPDDPASASTPVAASADDVRRLALVDDLGELDARVSVCSACPRLVAWREQVAEQKRASFADQPYWGRPIAGWGDARPGGADRRPGAGRQRRQPHRPGLHRRLVGRLAVRVAAPRRPGRAATSVHAADGQRLLGARMVATVRCAPPHNKPTTAERDTCQPWIERRARAAGVARARGGGAGLASAGTRRPRSRWPRPVRRADAAPAGSATAPRSARRPATGRRHPARLLPPQPAEHLHRSAHRTHARRRPRPRRVAADVIRSGRPGDHFV